MSIILPLAIVMTIASTGQPADSPELRTLARDFMSGIETSREAVVRTSEEWAALWRQHAGGTPAPAVDFATSTVVGIFLGTRPSAGFQAEITGVRKDGDGWVVEWRERRPARGDVSAQVLTSPAHIVALPKMAGSIRFEKSDT